MFHLLVVVMGIVGGVSFPPVNHSNVCTIITNPLIRAPSANLLIVTPLSESKAAGSWIDHPDSLQLDSAQRADTVLVYAELLKVDTVLGPDRDLLRQAFTRLGRQVIAIVPWEIGSLCERHVWGDSSRYLTPGHQVFLATKLRPQSEWIDGIPTFDSDRIVDLYDPHRFVTPSPDTEPHREFISVADYLEWYQTLPVWRTWRQDPPREARRLRKWIDQRHLGNKDPMPKLLSFMDEWVRDWRQGYHRDSF